jgi:hypothetical protein
VHALEAGELAGKMRGLQAFSREMILWDGRRRKVISASRQKLLELAVL